jgi:hypothetical protein
VLSTNLVPPFFGPRQPVYPIVPSVIRVMGPAQGPVYPCLNQQAAGGVPSLRDREPGWVYEPNGIPVPRGTYRARLVGNYNGLPLYVVSLICCVGRGSFSSASSSSSSSSGKTSAISIKPTKSSEGESEDSESSSSSSSSSSGGSLFSVTSSVTSVPSSAASAASSPTSVTSVTSKISSQTSAQSSCNLRTQFCLLVTPICSSSSSSCSQSSSSSPSGNQNCCSGVVVPNTLFATVQGAATLPPCNGTYTLTYDPIKNWWATAPTQLIGTACTGSPVPALTLTCTSFGGGGPPFNWVLTATGATFDLAFANVVSCQPLILVFDGSILGVCSCTASVTPPYQITITQ